MADSVKKISTVAVYCGSNEGKSPVFAEKAAELGAYLAASSIGVVFGGSRCGLLGKMGDALVANGGRLTGIVPEFFTKMEDYEVVGEEIIVPDMHTRKKMMFDQADESRDMSSSYYHTFIFKMADAFIALPGGIGTMEELTEVLTWSKLDLHSKPIGLLNVDGYYDHYLQWLSRAIQEGFINASRVEDLMVITDNPKHLVDRLCCEKAAATH